MVTLILGNQQVEILPGHDLGIYMDGVFDGDDAVSGVEQVHINLLLLVVALYKNTPISLGSATKKLQLTAFACRASSFRGRRRSHGQWTVFSSS